MREFLATHFPGVPADDIMQETMAALVARMPHYVYSPADMGPFHSYLYGILRNKSVDFLKRRDREAEAERAYTADAEIELFADELRIEHVSLDIEIGGKVGCVWLVDLEGHVELDVPVDLEVWADDVRGQVDVNQVGATSVLHVAHGAPFTATTRGRFGKRVLRFTRDGEPVEAPEAVEAPLAIELAGARCELTVDSLS